MKQFFVYLILFLAQFLCSITEVQAQKGYMGKKNYVSFSGLANVPLLSGAFSEGQYYDSNGSIELRKDWLDYGASFGYSRAVNKRSMIGFEATFKRFEVNVDRSFESSFVGTLIGRFEQTTALRSQQVRLNYIAVVPVFTFSPTNSIAGSGISHKIGAGFGLTSVVSGGYVYSINEFYSTDSTSTSWTPTDTFILDALEWKNYKSLVLTYEIAYQFPITDYLHLNTGFQYFANIYFKNDTEIFERDQQDYIKSEVIFFNTQREHAFTWNLKLGLTLAF